MPWPRPATRRRPRSPRPARPTRYGLEILLEEISDHPENFTRFVAISRGPVRPYVPGLPWRTALRVVTNHRPGALHEAIEPFRYHGVNMVSLHSRPIPGEPWRYQFSIDIDGHRDEETVQRALARRRAPVGPRGRARRLPDDDAIGGLEAGAPPAPRARPAG